VPCVLIPRTWIATLALGLWAAGLCAADLASEFVSPPDSARPWAYWWWLNGHVSRDGITHDLEAMAEQGIGGVLLFNAGGGATPPGLTFMGPEWRAMFRHALAEASRLGLEVSVNLCDGWDCGGPWITPEAANKKLVHSETEIATAGGGEWALPQPPTVDGFYRDVAVVAFRERRGTPVAPAAVTASSALGGYCDERNWPPSQVVDRDPETAWDPGPGGTPWLLFEYSQPLEARAITVDVPGADGSRQCRVEASDDGQQFRPLTVFPLAKPSFRWPLPVTTARYFRFRFVPRGEAASLEEASWIWFAEGDPAVSAPPGVVRFRRHIALPEGASVTRATFTGTADNAFTLYVNGQEAGSSGAESVGFRALWPIDVAAFLRPGGNVIAVEATNASDTPNPAGFIGRLHIELAGGRRVSCVTDGSWRAGRGALAGDARAAGFDDGAWPASKVVAPLGGGPWGRPETGQPGPKVAEAWLLRGGDELVRRPGTKWWPFKSGNRSFWDWPPQGPSVLREEYPGPDVCDVRGADLVDVTGGLGADGVLRWEAPPGRWTVLRFGMTLLGQRTRCGSTVMGYEADMLTSTGIESQFAHLADPLLAEAGGALGRALKYLHVDSYELGADVQGQQPTWCEDFRDQFRTRRGYDLLPYLPALARRVVDGREPTNRFLFDIRATIGDLMAERFFGRFAELAHARGVQMHSETGYGTYPHPHFDGLRCAGACDVTMGEFWHGTDIMSRFDPFCNVIRTVASAAHTYGRPITQAEAFTTWNHFLESPARLKALGDQAFCDGLNRMVFHQYTHQPRDDVIPGWQYGAGTHIDRHVTWWPMADAWFTYLARCQHLLQSGRFAADVAYFYGEGSSRYVPGRDHIRPALPPGYDFDCVNADVLQNRLSVRDGRLMLPDGASYRFLVLPEEPTLSRESLGAMRRLIEAGATVVGGRPQRVPGLSGLPSADTELAAMADGLWGPKTPKRGDRHIGHGRLIWGRSLAEVFQMLRLLPDFEPLDAPADASLRFIHRAVGDAEVYFVSNQLERPEGATCAFRVADRQPELWDPVTGRVLALPDSRPEGGRTTVRLDLAPAQSVFVVFRPGASAGAADAAFPGLRAVAELTGAWDVSFDPKWGGPEHTPFEGLIDWAEHPLEGVRHYSGTATYRRALGGSWATAGPSGRLYLDLGRVESIARVKLNGVDLGVLWCAPWRVEITQALRPGANELEIQVANLWANRLIGDAALPPEKRLAQTNVAFPRDHPLLPSGLLGPVTVLEEEPPEPR